MARLTDEQVRQLQPVVDQLKLGRCLLEVYINGQNKIVQATTEPLPPAGYRGSDNEYRRF